jgi:ATP-dependent protease HslVU (ClpYQ) peptidase subunit
MKRLFSLYILCFGVFIGAFAQSFTLTGRVTDEDGNAVDYVVKQFIEHVMDWRGDDKKDNS